MVLMIRKTVAETCARAVTAGALFVCGTLITAFPAYATTNGGGSNGGPTNPATTGVSSYVEGEIPAELVQNNQGRDNIELDKTLVVQNIVNTQNGSFLPSVPDVDFKYTVNYTNDWYTGANAGKKDYEVVTAADNVDAGGTVYQIWRGPANSVKFGVSFAEATDEGVIHFTHKDPLTGNAVKKTLALSIDGKAFVKPGVYRYVLIERMEEVDFEETDRGAAQVTDDIELRPTLLEKEGKQTGITGKDNSKLQERRFLDVYVEWKPQEDGLMVTDVVLHDILGNLVYGNLSDQDKDKAYSRPLFNEDGTIKRDENDRIIYESNDPENKYADPYDPSSILSGSKKTGFSDSIYTTYDLVIGKEIMGKGLTNYDITKRKYKFNIEIEAPAGTTLRTYQNVRTNGVKRADVKTDEANGTYTVTFELLQGQVGLISGLPAGSKYTVEEVDNTEEEGQPKTLELFETYYAANNIEKILLTPAHWTGNLEDQAARNVLLMERQGAYAKKRAGKSAALTAEEEKEVGLVLADKTEQYEIERMTQEDVANKKSVNHVFFLNLRYDNVVTGVAMSVAPYALMVIAAGVGIGVYAAAKKRNRDDDDEMDEM